MSRRVTIETSTLSAEIDLDEPWAVVDATDHLQLKAGALTVNLYFNHDFRGVKAAREQVHKCLKEAQQGSVINLQGLFNLLDKEFTDEFSWESEG